MPVPHAHIKWITDRLERVEKRLDELSKIQNKMGERALKMDEHTLKADKLLQAIFTDRCDGIDGTLLSFVERLLALEAKVLPNLYKDIRQLRKILPLDDGPTFNPLDKRKRKPK
jgi:hypothetical protein